MPSGDMRQGRELNKVLALQEQGSHFKPSIPIKSGAGIHFSSQCWEGRHRRIPGPWRPDCLAKSMSSRPVRDPAVKREKKDTHTHALNTHTHIHIHKHNTHLMHTCIYTHTHTHARDIIVPISPRGATCPMHRAQERQEDEAQACRGSPPSKIIPHRGN